MQINEEPIVGEAKTQLVQLMCLLNVCCDIEFHDEVESVLAKLMLASWGRAEFREIWNAAAIQANQTSQLTAATLARATDKPN